eukprot:s2816_g4.t1
MTTHIWSAAQAALAALRAGGIEPGAPSNTQLNSTLLMAQARQREAREAYPESTPMPRQPAWSRAPKWPVPNPPAATDYDAQMAELDAQEREELIELAEATRRSPASAANEDGDGPVSWQATLAAVALGGVTWDAYSGILRPATESVVEAVSIELAHCNHQRR